MRYFLHFSEICKYLSLEKKKNLIIMLLPDCSINSVIIEYSLKNSTNMKVVSIFLNQRRISEEFR